MCNCKGVEGVENQQQYTTVFFGEMKDIDKHCHKNQHNQSNKTDIILRIWLERQDIPAGFSCICTQRVVHGKNWISKRNLQMKNKLFFFLPTNEMDELAYWLGQRSQSSPNWRCLWYCAVLEWSWCQGVPSSSDNTSSINTLQTFIYSMLAAWKMTLQQIKIKQWKTKTTCRPDLELFTNTNQCKDSLTLRAASSKPERQRQMRLYL